MVFTNLPNAVILFFGWCWIFTYLPTYVRFLDLSDMVMACGMGRGFKEL